MIELAQQITIIEEKRWLRAQWKELKRPVEWDSRATIVTENVFYISIASIE